MVGSQLAGVVVRYMQKVRGLDVDEAFLRELSEMTGGGMPSERQQAGSPCGESDLAWSTRMLGWFKGTLWQWKRRART
jgi:hypothetical protein